jgi:hypothetical protein
MLSLDFGMSCGAGFHPAADFQSAHFSVANEQADYKSTAG